MESSWSHHDGAVPEELTTISTSSYTDLLEDENTRHGCDTTPHYLVLPPPCADQYKAFVDQNQSAFGRDATTINGGCGKLHQPSSAVATGAVATATAVDSFATGDSFRCTSRAVALPTRDGRANSRSSLSRALSASDLSNTLLLWPSALDGQPARSSLCASSGSTESPSLHECSQHGGKGGTGIGTSSSPSSPVANRLGGDDGGGARDRDRFIRTSNSKNTGGEPFHSPAGTTPTAGHAHGGRSPSGRAPGDDFGPGKGGPLFPLSPFHLFAGTQLSPISNTDSSNNNNNSSAHFSGDVHRPLCLKPLPFPRAMIMEYDEEDDRGDDAGGETTRRDRQKRKLASMPMGSVGDGTGTKGGRHAGTVGEGSNELDDSDRAQDPALCSIDRVVDRDGGGDSPDSRPCSLSVDLVSTMLSPPTLPEPDAIGICSDVCRRVESSANNTSLARAPGDIDGNFGTGGGGVSGDCANVGDGSTPLGLGEEDVEMHRIDLCDPAWSLNPVLAPMPMPSDDDEPAGCENVSNGDGGRESARRRRLLTGGRLVSVYSVNPEAQASAPSNSTAPDTSPRVHGDAMPFPRAHGDDAQAADVSVGAGDVASCTKYKRKRSTKYDSGNGGGSGNKKTGTKDSGSKKPRQHVATSGKDEVSLFRTSVGSTATDASAGSISPSSRNAPHPTSMAAGEIFPAVREATAPATPKHIKGVRPLVQESPARATLERTADASGCGSSHVRKVAHDGNRVGSSCNGSHRGGAQRRIRATSETASIGVCDVPSVDATAAEFCTPPSDGNEEATPNSGVLVPSAGTRMSAGVPADGSGGVGGGTETTTSATAMGASAVADGNPNLKPRQKQHNPSLNCSNDYPPAVTCTPAPTPAAAPVRAVRAVFRGRSQAGKQNSGVLINDEDSLPGPAIMAELNKGKGNGSKMEKSVRAPCTCKKCRCLKLYCDCFAGSRYCGPECLCKNCHNRRDQEMLQAARKTTLEKNPEAFTRAAKSSKDPATVFDGAGCGCAKSQCLKKYCVCFNKSVRCGSTCNCEGCLNKVGSRGSHNKHLGRDITPSSGNGEPAAAIVAAAATSGSSDLVGLSTPSSRNKSEANSMRPTPTPAPSASSSRPSSSSLSSSSSSSLSSGSDPEEDSDLDSSDIDLGGEEDDGEGGAGEEEAYLSDSQQRPEQGIDDSSSPPTGCAYEANNNNNNNNNNADDGKQILRVDPDGDFAQPTTSLLIAPRTSARRLVVLAPTSRIPSATVPRPLPLASALGASLTTAHSFSKAAGAGNDNLLRSIDASGVGICADDDVGGSGGGNTVAARRVLDVVGAGSRSLQASLSSSSSCGTSCLGGAFSAQVRRGPGSPVPLSGQGFLTAKAKRVAADTTVAIYGSTVTSSPGATGAAAAGAAASVFGGDGAGARAVGASVTMSSFKNREKELAVDGGCGGRGRRHAVVDGGGYNGRGSVKRVELSNSSITINSSNIPSKMSRADGDGGGRVGGVGVVVKLVLPKRRKVVLASPKDELFAGTGVFGPYADGFPKRSAELSFSFLDNDDVYNASLVSGSWSELAMSSAIWEAS